VLTLTPVLTRDVATAPVPLMNRAHLVTKSFAAVNEAIEQAALQDSQSYEVPMLGELSAPPEPIFTITGQFLLANTRPGVHRFAKCGYFDIALLPEFSLVHMGFLTRR
jgi:hypothetical protein